MKQIQLIAAIVAVCGALSAQTAPPVYRVTVTDRSAKSISYQNRSGSTKIGFSGTLLLPDSHGDARVQGKKGYIAIEAEFRELPEASKFGAEYLTYVLWAITPDGRTANLGEILRNGTSGKLDVTTQLQAFALVVTAEPYFAVSRPSDVVVMENVVLSETIGSIESMDAKYELLQRGQYEHLTNVLNLKIDRKVPLEIYEARNAVAIARSSGAATFATETFNKAEVELNRAEVYLSRKSGTKPITMSARKAVQTAEDARAIAVKRQDEELASAERQGAADRQARAENGRDAAQSETARVSREAADAKLHSETEAARLKAANDASSLSAQEDAARLKVANDADRETARLQSERMKLDADRMKAESDSKLATAQSGLDQAAREKSDLRALLLLQFNTILQTRDTARGLIVSMSDVLFDTAMFTLRPEAREKLARVGGIVSGHPGLSLEVEGHTDSVGADDYNQQLSEHRSDTVRQFLIQQGMGANAVTSKGFGKTQPVASNDTAEGRQQNRRVELVISGDLIGFAVGVPLADK
jgi:outer membrane protein OmpA-like peptidoglycan-associated protein